MRTTYRMSGLVAAILAGTLGALLLLSASGASAGDSGQKPQRCFGEPATVNGLVGTPGNDVIVGTNGDDEIDGKGGKDRICGRMGRDELHGGTGNDIIHGGAGRDLIFGENGADRLFGNGGLDGRSRECKRPIITRDSANRGSNGFECCFDRRSAAGDSERGGCPFRAGGGGQPKSGIFGGKGNDLLGGGNGNDALYGEEGTDIHRGATGYDTCLDEDIDSSFRSCERNSN